MALEIILTCLVLVNALNVALICDLYGRSARLTTLTHDACAIGRSLAHTLEALKGNPTE